MEKKAYLLAGQFRGGKQDGLGLSLFRSRENGAMEHLQTVREDVAAGWICMDEEKGLVYAVDEKKTMAGRIGGGACVYTFRFDPETERLAEIGCTPTLSAVPSYVCLDRQGKHILVSHNGGSGAVTRILREENGGFRTETVFDDAAVTVLRLDEEGVPCGISDMYIAQNEGEFGPRAVITEGLGGILANPGTAAHLHCAALSPDGSVLICCDFGQGKIHSFRYDGEEGKLAHADTFAAPVESGVRYIAFHPVLPVAYVNCENSPLVLICNYDPASGRITRVQEWKYLLGPGSRDLLLNPEGTRMYLTVNDNSVCVLDVAGSGGLELRGKVPCQGTGARALALDGNCLYCGCNRSATVEIFDVDKEGMPSGGRIVAEGISASVLKRFDI